MKHLLIVSISLALAFSSNAQILLSDFSDLNAQNPAFNGSWDGGSPSVPQYIQGSGFISITPVNGGNPQNDGSFISLFDNPITLAGFDIISLTLRVDSGNTAPSFSIILYDSALATANAVFSLASFDSTFTTQQQNLIFDSGFNPNEVVAWSASGTNAPPDQPVRVSLDNVSVVPEPSSLALLLLSGAGLLASRRRR
jgi:hypothetical protein